MVNRVKSEVQWISSAGFPLVRVRPKATDVAAIICGPRYSCYVHWISDLERTQPCVVFNCRYCQEQIPRRAVSYIGILHFRMSAGEFKWLPAVLEVPFHTGELLERMLGQRVALKRERQFGPVNVGRFLFDEPLPPAKPLSFIPQLLGMWRIASGDQVAIVGNLGPAND